uniref:Uncharacterized protein n=1 Tax=Kalanchoe fedtschenkoi TaxID=63787 RepID=A0A7N0U975_KALFE
MFLEIFAPIGPFVSICIRISIHGSLERKMKLGREGRLKQFILSNRGMAIWNKISLIHKKDGSMDFDKEDIASIFINHFNLLLWCSQNYPEVNFDLLGDGNSLTD